MKSYSNFFNAGVINMDLPNLFHSISCLTSNNQHINNIKVCEGFAEDSKQYASIDIQDDKSFYH